MEDTERSQPLSIICISESLYAIGADIDKKLRLAHLCPSSSRAVNEDCGMPIVDRFCPFQRVATSRTSLEKAIRSWDETSSCDCNQIFCAALGAGHCHEGRCDRGIEAEHTVAK